MELKNEIKKLLEDLEKCGWGRREIEKELEYNDNYLAQAMSKGGNIKLLNKLKKLLDRVSIESPTDEPVVTVHRSIIIEALLRNVLKQIARDRADRKGAPEMWKEELHLIDADTIEEMNKIASRLGLPKS
ncbi:hypothetical protein [Chitinophaga sancti]|uniref:Uncharacterized protein n=1 Tax=Chitinophaga sancti TaxID=1004 RepID=A0A1K1M102_9BACT|nr:hypothetical protein [Chitinophaga sancti]WQD64714.1 hypothetical protein U0033_09930 [Chitinophaga sancti]WQG89664.1 hypothetical protein SR876_32545 [Chitinophaga sancti]SFW16793.1 hypothetical protein SAMN05661012_00359 [Chitinophaga sancti]